MLMFWLMFCFHIDVDVVVHGVLMLMFLLMFFDVDVVYVHVVAVDVHVVVPPSFLQSPSLPRLGPPAKKRFQAPPNPRKYP